MVTPVPIPDPINALIAGLVLFLVVNGLKALSELLGRDLSGWGTIVAAGLTLIVSFNLSVILGVISSIGGPQAASFITGLLQALVILLGGMGVKRFETRTLRGK